VTLVQTRASLKVDEAGWKKSLEDATSIYRAYPEIQSLSAFARFSVLNEYFVNSEGTVTRTGRNAYSVQLSASTQAPDGMRLARSPAWTVAKYEELPTSENWRVFARGTRNVESFAQCADRGRRISRAGTVRSGRGGRCNCGLVGNNVLGRKPQLGAPNRTTGAFATSYKSRVLPPFMDAVDDPTMKEFQEEHDRKL